MSIDKDLFYIAVALLTAIASSFSVWKIGQRRPSMPHGDDECLRLKTEFAQFEKIVASMMFGPAMAQDDIAIVLYNLTGQSVTDLTLSQGKAAQAIAVMAETKKRGLFLQVLPAIYKQCPHLLNTK